MAASWLARESVDLAILDAGHVTAIRLDLFGLLYQLHSRLPVVVYTTYEPEDNGPVARLATAYVVKNSNLDPLMDTVRRLVPPRRATAPAPFLHQVPEPLLCGDPVGQT